MRENKRCLFAPAVYMILSNKIFCVSHIRCAFFLWQLQIQQPVHYSEDRSTPDKNITAAKCLFND